MTAVTFTAQDHPATDSTRCGACHSMDEIVGYRTVLTRFGSGRVQDFRVYGDNHYGVAVEDAQMLRNYAATGKADAGAGAFLADLPPFDYARIDVLYADGCRGIL